MKSISLLALFLNFFVITATAQLSKDIPAFGKIDIADLKMNDCSFDPGAEAVYLLRYEEVTLSAFENYTTQVLILKRYRIKILKKSGFKFSNISIDYDRKGAKVTNLEGAIYNLAADGQIKVTPIDKSDIYKTKSTKKDRIISFTFPEVKEGSVIEYQFTQKIKDAYFMPTWYFQSSIPNVLSVCKVSRSFNSLLQKKVIGEWPLEQDSLIRYPKGEDRREQDNYYVMRNVPAFIPEPFMSTSRDYRYRIDFVTAPKETSYDVLVRQSNNIWLRENLWLLMHPYFGGQFGAYIPGTKKIIDSVKKLNNVSAKIAAVYRYVKQKIRWDQNYFLLSRDMKDVWEEGEGTSAEINLSILNLLRKCDVTCFPVLYSTRSHGKVDYNFPSLGQFNTVNIAVVNGKKFQLLDGTSPFLSYETPPLDVVNRTGMLIDRLNHTRINIDFNRKLLWDSVFVYANIDSNGILHGKIVKKYFDLAKTVKLQNESETDEKDEDNINLSVNISEIKADSSYQLDMENELLPLTEISTFHYELPSTNDFHYFSPFLFSNLSKNPFTDTARNTDVDFIANTSSVVHIEISLPPKIKVEELPKDKELNVTDSSVSFIFHNEIKNNTIYINCSLEINKPVFEKTQYADLRENFKIIYSLLSNPVLLRRINK